ncbi:MAG: 3-phosphoserine/phosphohydroxythreonine transaminase [Clostridia bacterium]
MRVYNFSAGPSTMPVEVLETIQKELLDTDGAGYGHMEGSHRAKPYEAVNNDAQALLRELLNIPENYYILFLQGGATQQFEAIPLNLLGKNNKADYFDCGHWATRAATLAKPYADVNIVASSKEAKYTYVPSVENLPIRPDAAYLHVTSNNTIFGTRMTKYPKTNLNMIADMSSDILSRPINVADFAVIYAGAQKNMSCAGLTTVIVRKDLVDNDYTMPICPSIMKWKTHADANSLYNTPPTFAVYVLLRMLQWLKGKGGVEGIQIQNEAQAKRFYDYVDNSKMFSNPVNKADRSVMNLIFHAQTPELEAQFVAEAKEAKIVSIKGHKSVGGLRASFYNAVTDEMVDYLLNFMREFERKHLNECK